MKCLNDVGSNVVAIGSGIGDLGGSVVSRKGASVPSSSLDPSISLDPSNSGSPSVSMSPDPCPSSTPGACPSSTPGACPTIDVSAPCPTTGVSAPCPSSACGSASASGATGGVSATIGISGSGSTTPGPCPTIDVSAPCPTTGVSAPCPSSSEEIHVPKIVQADFSRLGITDLSVGPGEEGKYFVYYNGQGKHVVWYYNIDTNDAAYPTIPADYYHQVVLTGLPSPEDLAAATGAALAADSSTFASIYAAAGYAFIRIINNEPGVYNDPEQGTSPIEMSVYQQGT